MKARALLLTIFLIRQTMLRQIARLILLHTNAAQMLEDHCACALNIRLLISNSHSARLNLLARANACDSVKTLTFLDSKLRKVRHGK